MQIKYTVLLCLLSSIFGWWLGGNTNALVERYVREVTFISVTCKDPALSYTEPADISDDFKCDWKEATFLTKLQFNL